ncbi:hypothetical protein SAMN05660209_04633 [Geodermatophilus africanus]|uniref:Uncharacterized protein n=1 Tax=Geodermatophilus africanus TaxID=1137993 RepID=A0A1H3Q6N5_9ACTN|nr:hypothetical protein [Geodermatophilus africanus]SDZ09047.1 hypothetical protein SAMN05660209_04633 [Geodermatophilus africanus]
MTEQGLGTTPDRRDRSRRPSRRALRLVVPVVLVTAAVAAGAVAVLRDHREEYLLDVQEVDGGPAYYDRFSPSLPSDPSQFPIGVWLESVTSEADIRQDAAAGINLYVGLTEDSDLSLIRDAGMMVIHDLEGKVGEETVGWLVSDEADMWGGPGEDEWTGRRPGDGDICTPAGGRCGYTVQTTRLEGLPNDNRLRYSNYGKGVAFWETDEEAARFVNNFQDVVSVDVYWYTDESVCGLGEGGNFFGTEAPIAPAQCHRAANYGLTVDRVRALVDPPGSRPVWAFVEVGHPFPDDSFPTITPEQVRAAVWSSLIHGARGIVYFNHSFGGPCPTQHALRDPCYTDVREEVTRVNQQVADLAPVLNSPSVQDFVRVDGDVDTLVKLHEGSLYVLAASREQGLAEVRFSMPCAEDSPTVTVLGESRTVPVNGGRFTDSFGDETAVHLYRVDGEPSCRFSTS